MSPDTSTDGDPPPLRGYLGSSSGTLGDFHVLRYPSRMIDESLIAKVITSVQPIVWN